MNDSSERTSFLDFLIATLTEHEKALSETVDKLEKVCTRLERIAEESEKA